MDKNDLLIELEQNQCLDLIKLYQANPSQHFYTLVEQLYTLRDEHELTTRISRFKTDVEKLTQSLNDFNVAPEQFKQIAQSLDLNQRTQKVIRFMQTQDNHIAFAKPVDLVMYGDSITEWGPWHDGIQGVTLANRGLSGDTTDGMKYRIESTTVCQPKLICMMAGINDLSQGYSVDEIMENYSQMLNYWHQRDIEVWVQSTLFVGQRLNELNPLVAQLNQGLIKLCNNTGAKYIDLNAVICPEGFLPLTCSADDLHLNSYAYGKWLSLLTPMLDDYFKHV
ncbi:SGNH/GDSL hydrolase family protein [Vibrio plantisponsor]|jgi:hypothetical protein|uniref:SGNH/GDSL hydrolase family protein n=1 Tax=Vibrio plantisponsor TaxID=664643 RepID=A0ABU4IHA9_9VIBR|nr:SGNH/GDSL hydrolase family protein [Vibrio plantisponsor]MDW6016649.1 SGNH/GDSL hydrolase family protein [Vibrio plantisponsor]NNM39980.1 lysophospholipase [Vibrio plantisponsor]PNH89569.1 lysophospholipase [Vibrio diazotrophicus]